MEFTKDIVEKADRLILDYLSRKGSALRSNIVDELQNKMKLKHGGYDLMTAVKKAHGTEYKIKRTEHGELWSL